MKHKRHKNFPLRPKVASLLVLDMQDYFVDKKSHAFVPASAEIIPRTNQLAKAFKKSGRPIFFTRHIDIDPKNLMSRWWNDRIQEDNPLSRLSNKLVTSDADIIIKHQYDAFFGTGLEEKLRESKSEQVIITGVATHLCCETTARSAFMRDFETFFVTDCTADYDPEYHKAAILNLAHGFAVPVTSDAILKSVKG